MVALLAVTGVLNVVLNANASTPVKGGGGITYSSFFDSFRADRSATREQTMLYLDAIIESAETSSEILAEAQSSKIAITNSMDTENTLEYLIKALGYNEVVITTSTSNINVIIKADDLTDVEVASIVQIITSETEKSPSDIRIIPVN
jgi:stage III sporulation protein AH